MKLSKIHTDARQVAADVGLFSFRHCVQTEVPFEGLLGDGGSNERRVITIGHDTHRHYQGRRIHAPVVDILGSWPIFRGTLESHDDLLKVHRM